MNNEVKQEWVKRLRSGQYKQGRNSLRQGDSYCCLGVLCDLYSPQLWEQGPEGTFCYAGASGVLPSIVSEAYGISHDPMVATRDLPEKLVNNPNFDTLSIKYCSLSELNDHGYTFEEIAEVIEKVDFYPNHL